MYGGFPITRKPNRHGLFNNDFWNQVTETDETLPTACGCYIFALQNGGNIVTWYVGKTEKRTFYKECFEATKINYYNEIRRPQRGADIVPLAAVDQLGEKFSKPTRSGYCDIDFLEILLSGMALEQKNLANIKKTKLLREMIVPGVINSPQARPTGPVIDLRKTRSGLT